MNKFCFRSSQPYIMHVLLYQNQSADLSGRSHEEDLEKKKKTTNYCVVSKQVETDTRFSAFSLRECWNIRVPICSAYSFAA